MLFEFLQDPNNLTQFLNETMETYDKNLKEN